MLDRTRRSRIHSAARHSPALPTGAVETPTPAAKAVESPSVEPDRRATYTCTECGHVLRVNGLGRHRVYFEPTDHLRDDPVMNRRCPGCGHGLPGK